MKEHTNTRFQGLIAATLIGAIFILSVVTAKDYGITWDELSELYVAERNLKYALTLDPKWMDFSIPVNFAIKGRHPILPHGLPPWRIFFLGNFLSSIGCYLFFFKLNIMNSVTAHHFPNKLLFLGMLVTVFLFLRRNFDIYTALAAIPFIAFQPRFWADMQFNLKDFPYACFMAFTLIAVRNAALKSSWKGIILSASLLGLAGATKPNAGLIVIITAAWIYFARSAIKKVSGKGKKLYWISVGLSPLIAIAVFFLVWPYLWIHPVENFKEFLNFYLDRAVKGPPHFQWIELYLFLAVQPPAVLLFGSIGIVLGIVEAIRGVKRELNILLLLWLFMPVLRVTLPKVYDYDGVRHFIEYAIPLGIVTARGFVHFCKWFYGVITRRIPRKAAIASVTLSAALLPAGWAYTSYKIHPYEIAYFNFIVGGTKGAQQIWPDATDYWGSSYRDGMKWLNAHAEPGAIVAVPIANHIAEGVYTIWLRGDLKLRADISDISGLRPMNEYLSPESEALLYDYFKKPDKQLYVMYITRRDRYSNLVKFLERNENPVYVITVDGAPILKIFKNNYSGATP